MPSSLEDMMMSVKLSATQSGKLSQFVDNKGMEFRSKLLFSFYCRSDYQTIGYKEMSRFLCDLNATESRIATELMKFDLLPTNWTCTFTEFQESYPLWKDDSISPLCGSDAAV
jgi:hypothetical protein